MASIAHDKNGCRRILFVAPDGKRKTVRLGKPGPGYTGKESGQV